uniref:Uncharacterized protein n=1 Tax=Rhizophora mucronata TaxID=61149 RepID=A0A2P2R3I0_RHIMU
MEKKMMRAERQNGRKLDALTV